MTEAERKRQIREFSEENLVLSECLIPELGEAKAGKVREIYFANENVVMVTNDRVSAFDFILPNLIPFKGQVLNGISEWAMGQTEDIVPNALYSKKGVDPSVVVQKKMRNLNVECIVRGYLWGSMAAAYEKGARTFCGLDLQEGLLRFQKFPTPLFTPTTKAETGHDENMTMAEVEALLGAELAAKVKDVALRLYARGAERMRERGLVLIDTKYEFGLDDAGKLHVIDEVNTPDSSRLCDVVEWDQTFPKVEERMKGGQFRNVTELLKQEPKLKIKEYSKQYVRDALLEMGFDPQKATEAPKLSDDQVVECSYRYIKVYERITGQPFVIPEMRLSPERRVLYNLQRQGLLVGCCAVLFASSEQDLQHLDRVRKGLQALGVPSIARICSAASQPARLEEILRLYNKSIEPCVILGCAAVGAEAETFAAIASRLSLHPVISCPAMPHTGAAHPAGGPSSAPLFHDHENAVRFAATALAYFAPKVRQTLRKRSEQESRRLEMFDQNLTGGKIAKCAHVAKGGQ